MELREEKRRDRDRQTDRSRWILPFSSLYLCTPAWCLTISVTFLVMWESKVQAMTMLG